MNRLRKVVLIVAAGLLSIILSGCAGLLPKPVFTDSAGGQAYLLQALQNKYGMAFEVVGPPSSPNSDPVWFIATVAPVDQPAKKTQAGVKQAGGTVMDDFAQYLYKDQIEAMAKAACAPLTYLTSCEVNIDFQMTVKKWDSSTPLDTFIKTSTVRNMIKVTLQQADSDDQYVSWLLDLQDKLIASGAYFEVNAYIGTCLAWSRDYDASRTRLHTASEILETIQGKTSGTC
ncbi:MAG: hypothetical protein FWF43_04790 [Propionibacteriaceae bacterium]|nr:hypothetical protein [Propionibacteriaceae bacterium]